MGEQGGQREIRTAKEAADDELVLAFGRLQGAANRLEYILGREIERECGITHLMYEVLLILGRAGEPGLSMRAISQEQVLPQGEDTAVRASRLHVENIRRYLLAPLPAAERERFAEDLRIISHAARDALPLLP